MARTMTMTVLGAGAVLALVGLTGCTTSDPGADGPEPEPSSLEGGPMGPDLASIPDVVAEIDGEPISRDEFLQAFETQFTQASLQAAQQGATVDEGQLRREVAENFVNVELLKREAERQGIAATQDDVDQLAASLAAQNQLGSVDELFALLAEQGLTEDEAREELAAQATIDAVIAAQVGDVSPTEEELRALYDAALEQQGAAGGDLADVPSFEEVRGQLEQQAVATEQSRAVEALIADLRAAVEIEFFV